jgi:hypothetical protein
LSFVLRLIYGVLRICGIVGAAPSPEHRGFQRKEHAMSQQAGMHDSQYTFRRFPITAANHATIETYYRVAAIPTAHITRSFSFDIPT